MKQTTDQSPQPLGDQHSRTLEGLDLHTIDVNGNSGVGQIAKFGTCATCSKERIVGPRDTDDPSSRTCFGGCDSQRGMTVFERKIAAMNWRRK